MSLLEKLTEQQALEFGDAAKRILTDPAFNRAVTAVAQMYADEWRNSAPGDTSARETLYHKANVLDDVVVALAKVMGDGKVAADTRARAKVRPIR